MSSVHESPGEAARQAHLAAIIDCCDDAILSADLDGVVVSWNGGAASLFGHDREDAVGRPVGTLLGGPADDLPEILDRLERSDRVMYPRARLRTRAGFQVIVSLAVSPVRDRAGALIGVSMVVRDNGDSQRAQPQAEAELRVLKGVHEISRRLIPGGEVRSLYRELIDSAIDLTGGDRGTMQELDPATGELLLLESLGFSPSMLDSFARIGPDGRTSCALALRRGERAVVDYVHDDEVAGTEEARMHLDAGVRAAQSTPLVARSGRVLGMLTTHWDGPRRLTPAQADLLDILARQAADLIERTQAEEALRASDARERLRSEQVEMLLDQAPMGIYFVDSDFRLQRVNPAARAAFEAVPGGGIGRDFEEVLRAIWGGRADKLVRIFRQTLATGEPYHNPEFAERRADRGLTEYYDWRVERITLPEGGHGAVCYFRDISEQVQARLEIAESEERYRALFETMGEGFCILELIFDDGDNPIDYRYTETNPAFAKHTGLTDAAGRTIRELLPDIEPSWFDNYGRVALTGESMHFIEHATSMGRWFDVEAFRVGEPAERRVAVLFSDVTEQQDADRERSALVAEIDRQRRLYDAILSSTPDLIYVFDLDYRLRFGNRALLEMWGRTLDDSVGLGVREFGRDEWHAEMLEGEVDQVVRTKKPIRGEVALPHATLGERVYDYIFVPVLDGDGTVESVAGTTRDITDLKQAERALRESEERLLLAKSASQLGIHDYDVVNGHVGWDQRTREIWGVGADEPITYEVWLEGIHPDDRVLVENAVRRALDPNDDADYAADYRVIDRGSGDVRWVHVTGQPTFVNEEPVRLVGTVQDVTERKLTEEALKEASRRKDEFLATLSHELRNPLAAIRTGVAVLRSDGDLPDRARRMASVIDRQSAQLVRLVDDLLDVSRISRGIVNLERTPTDLGMLMTEVVADTAAASTEEGLDLQVVAATHPVMADVDPVRAEQVFRNLLHNACKFTPPGGTIHVGVDREGGEAVVRIVDSGIGMRQDDLTRVFDIFTQVAGSQHDQSRGLGIGLALARAIVDLHGGSITARSEGPGRGSEFIVRLPLAAEVADVEGSDGGADQNGPVSQKGLRILAAEDNEDVLDTLALLLRIRGHEVETAVDGGEALEKLRSYRPDVALLDIGMPVMSGYEVAQAIRRESWAADMLLIAMTGWGREEDKREASEAGFDAHLTKPVEVEVLEAMLESAYKPPSAQGPQSA